MKKSITLLIGLFVVAVIGWISSPSLFVNTRERMARFIQGEQISVAELNNDGDDDVHSEPIDRASSSENTGRIVLVAPESDIEPPSVSQVQEQEQERPQLGDIEETPEPTVQEAPSQAVVLDSFTSPDPSYSSRGQLALRTEGGRRFLEFNNFSVSNGPDLFITLNRSSNPNSGNLGSHIKLGRLQSTSGSQRYDVTDVDLSQYESLAVYCDRFSKVFAVAQL